MQHQKAAKQAGVQESRHTHTPEQSTPAAEDVLLQRALEQAESAPLTPALMRSLNRLAGNHAANGVMQRRLGTVGQIAGARLVIQRAADDDIVAHGYDKHVVKQKEWGDPPISQDDYRKVINDVLASPENKALKNGRHAYWKNGVIVIVNSSNPSQSTCFKPTDGKPYYDKQV